jgi:hypothetical protein
VFGGCAVDVTSQCLNTSSKGNSNIGEVKLSAGGKQLILTSSGCARNVTECLVKLGLTDSLFISAMGGKQDPFAHYLQKDFERLDISRDGVYIVPESCKNNRTAVFSAVLAHDGDFMMGIADMDIFKEVPTDFLERFSSVVSNTSVLVVDSNFPEESI